MSTLQATSHAPFAARFLRYLAARFPLAAYAPMVLAAGWAAVAYSAALRGAGAGGSAVAGAAGTLLALFFALRVLDEHKDAAHDRRWRPELPVPSGLVALRELAAVTTVIALGVVLAHALFAPALLPTLVLAGVWMALMAREFLARDWLRARPGAYLLSHMVVMPLALLHASAFDWALRGSAPGPELALFLCMSFANGLVLEVGRKLKAPQGERQGVETYTAAWGFARAVVVWFGCALLSATLLILVLARVSTAVGTLILAAAGSAALLACGAALVTRQSLRGQKLVEAASGAWNLFAYALVAGASTVGGAL